MYQLFLVLSAVTAAPPREAPTAGGRGSGGRSRRLYDRGCLFSPEGRVYQVEYAQRAIERGGAACGIVGEDCVVVGAVRSSYLRSADEALLPRDDDGWRERVHRIDEHIVCVSCGLVPDARQLLRALQKLASDHRRTWGSRMPIGLVAARLSEYVQSATLRSSTRPFGAAFLLAGYDDHDGTFRLYKTDPAGFFDEMSKTGTIAAPAAAREALEKSHAEGLDARAAASLLVAKGLAGQDETQFKPSDLELARVHFRDGRIVSDILTRDQIEQLLPVSATPTVAQRQKELPQEAEGEEEEYGEEEGDDDEDDEDYM